MRYLRRRYMMAETAEKRARTNKDLIHIYKIVITIITDIKQLEGIAERIENDERLHEDERDILLGFVTFRETGISGKMADSA